ncbi:MAG: SDR family oxidoreductase [Proteobacteria bacterium]|nr:SDR family oxidoreductase [Pseudomonadota bacterium]
MSDGLIVLVGATGILGRAFAQRLPARRLVKLGRADLDPADPVAIRRRMIGLTPRLVINCAADTDVEGAESAPERAFAVNATLAQALAEGAAETSAAFVHFSSTGCYGDWKSGSYVESDPLRPTTAHHRGKALGEEAVLRAHPEALVLRLGWVFGGIRGQRRNFVWARIQEAQGKAEIGADPRQLGSPTAAADVAAQTIAVLGSHQTGVFNCVGGGAPARRLDYVAAILEAAGSPARANPAEFSRRAPVSSNEAADNARLRACGLDRMPPWRESLAAFVRSQLDETPAECVPAASPQPACADARALCLG